MTRPVTFLAERSIDRSAKPTRRAAYVGASVVGALAASLLCVLGTSAQQPTFRGRSDVVRVFVTVMDRDGRLVTDLAQDDFEVRDDGKAQPITAFDNTPLPIRLIVMLDVSGSMVGNLPLLHAASDQLFSRLRPDDAARVGTFGHQVEISPTFMKNTRRLSDSLPARIDPDAPTPLWRAIDEALSAFKGEDRRSDDRSDERPREDDRRSDSDDASGGKGRSARDEFNRRVAERRGDRRSAEERAKADAEAEKEAEADSRRRAEARRNAAQADAPVDADVRNVILVLSDGKDSGPIGFRQKFVSQVEIIERARAEGVMIYAVGMRSRGNRPMQPPGVGPGALGAMLVADLPDPGLARVAEETGGGYIEIRLGEDLATAFARVADELHSQYLLGYAPPKRDGKIHEIDVRLLKQRSLKPRARKDYVAPKE
jgi:VWFA-related protein